MYQFGFWICSDGMVLFIFNFICFTTTVDTLITISTTTWLYLLLVKSEIIYNLSKIMYWNSMIYLFQHYIKKRCMHMLYMNELHELMVVFNYVL